MNIGTSDEIVEIICTPKHKQEGHFEGIIYVKTSNTNIVKITGEIHYANDPKVKKIKNPYDSFIINYRENKNGFSVLDNLTFTKVLTFSGGVDKQITESAKLIVYEYNNEVKTESMENAMIKSDIDLIKKKPYD